MPPEAGSVLAQVAHSPCSDSDGLAALPFDVKSNYLPVVELGRRLAALLALNVGLAERLPDLIWRSCPAPLPACRELDELISTVDAIEQAAQEARSTLLFLWEIAAAEHEGVRDAEVP